MGAELRRLHRASLTERVALLTYDSMCRERKRQCGRLDDHAELIIYNIAQVEQTMEQLRADISARGAVETIDNGKQHFVRQNRSGYELARLADRQARLSARLGMAGGNKPAGEEDIGESIDDI